MEPGAGQYGRNMGRPLDVVCVRGCVAGAQDGKLFGVELLYQAESAKLAFKPVEVTVVVSVAGNETVAADSVVGFDALDHVHREGQPGDPGLPCQFVCQVKPRGGDISHVGFSAQVVHRLNEKVRLLPTHQVNVAHGPT